MKPMTLRTALLACAAGACQLTLLLSPSFIGPAEAQTLEEFAALPADTFAPGPTSGQFIAPANGRIPPFPDKQPVQGFSSVLQTGDGDFLVMSDNGFGAKNNSADYVLRVYRIDPDFRTRNGGRGKIAFKPFFTLRDPHRKVYFPIVADAATYPNGTGTVPVDPQIRQNRLLTGSDFDIESFRRAHDGTYWFGDEFGPFLLHTDASGRLLDAPFPLPGVQSPDSPHLGSGVANLPRSRGFEGMAISRNGKRLYPMLEGALTTDPDQRRLLINEFDVRSKSYTGRQWSYRLEAPAGSGQAIGDFTAVTDRDFLVIERDGGQGPAALFKKVFLVNLDEVDASGFLVKREVVDLLNIADPHDIGGTGTGVFTFPFVTIESVIPLGKRRIGVLNDNNYPFSSGRTAGQPDNNEFIVIKLDKALPGGGHHDDDDEDDK